MEDSFGASKSRGPELIPHSFQPSFFSTTSCSSRVFGGLLERKFTGKNGEAIPRNPAGRVSTPTLASAQLGIETLREDDNASRSNRQNVRGGGFLLLNCADMNMLFRCLVGPKRTRFHSWAIFLSFLPGAEEAPWPSHVFNIRFRPLQTCKSVTGARAKAAESSG